jgi:hypothetical protein
MKIQSSMCKKDYMNAMRKEMSGHFELGVERLTGFFLGSCFYVTYHSGFEWNRKYTNQKNAAMGYVKSTAEGCEIRFLRFRGAMCPLVFLPLLIVMILLGPLPGGDDFFLNLKISVIATFIAAPILTIFECCTEESEQGRRRLLSFLKDPAEPRKHLPYIP